MYSKGDYSKQSETHAAEGVLKSILNSYWKTT